ncbi:MAG: glycerate kinase [Verrucomicrobiota bacterium]
MRPIRLLVASDKFKGSLTAAEANAAIIAGIQEAADPASFDIQNIPIADGGDGMAESLTEALGGQPVECLVQDALGDPMTSEYGWIDPDKTAIIEMARASGLAMLDPNRLDPWRASTFGTGQLILDGIQRGAKKIILGIGGSATNDGGTGMAKALGYQFKDAAGNSIESIPGDLESAVTIDPPDTRWPEILVACDVTNPLLGKDGCTRVYGPQKGILVEELESHEVRLRHLVSLTGEHLGAEAPGAGAAGGLGFGASCFLDAELRPGFDLVSQSLDLEAAVEWADIIITGEGKLDRSSLQGKAPGSLVSLAHEHQTPTLAFCGCCDVPSLASHFGPIFEILNPDWPLEKNLSEGASLLTTTAAQATSELFRLLRSNSHPTAS